MDDRLLYHNEVKINAYKIIVKKEAQWHFQTDGLHLIKLGDDVDSFLSKNEQYVQISPFIIINLDYVEHCLFSGTGGFFIISNKRFDIPRRFVSKVKNAHKTYLNQKYNSLINTDKGSWISKCKKYSQLDSSTIAIDIKNIKYFFRKGTKTIAYFDDGQKKVYYEALKYFEEHIDTESLFLRICRNYIINIKYINSYSLNPDTKTGEVEIDSLNLSISRRLLPNFKKIVKRNSLSSLLMEKRI